METISILLVASDVTFKGLARTMLTSRAGRIETDSIGTLDLGVYFEGHDKAYDIILADLKTLQSRDIAKTLHDFLEKAESKAKVIMAYVSNDHEKMIESLESMSPKLKVKCGSFIRTHFDEVFNMLEGGSSKGVASKAQDKNIVIAEAAAHVKETVDHLRELAQDRKQINKISDIGQKFNGIWGTFNHFAAKPGYGELAVLAQIIDVVGRTYGEKSGKTEISEEHFKLLVDASKCAYAIIITLSKNQNVAKENVDEAAKLQEVYDKMANLDKRQGCSQNEVDSLLSQLGFSVMTCVFFIALFGVFIAAMTTREGFRDRLASKAIIQSEREDVRNLVRFGANCWQSCDQVLSQTPKVIGNWEVRGTCKEDGIFFEVKLNQKSKNVSNTQIDVWEPLFKTFDGTICQKKISKLDSLKEAASSVEEVYTDLSKPPIPKKRNSSSNITH